MNIDYVIPKDKTVVFSFEKNEDKKLTWLLTFLAKPHGSANGWPEYMFSHRYDGSNAVYIYNVSESYISFVRDLMEDNFTTA